MKLLAVSLENLIFAEIFLRVTGGNTYRHDLDLLKGLAIIAVVLYHASWCKSGYLGVDVFFVLSGYLIVPKVMDEINEGRFRYWYFLEKRAFRLLPMVLLVCGLSLVVGYWGMLPMDLRFLSEETLATSVFANNILQSITTQNYWAAIYHKVLMHTWFLGVLFQFYVVFPLLMLLFRQRMKTVFVILTLLSVVLYLLPIDTIGNKYYLLPYRFYEIAVGGIIAVRAQRLSATVSYLLFILVLLMIFFGAFTIGERAMPYNLVGGTNTIRESFLPREMMVILTVAFALLYIYTSGRENRISVFARHSKLFAPLGRMSLSLFLWHQPLLAFYRYFYADEISPMVLCEVVVLTLLLSLLSYHLLEKRIRINTISRLCLLFSFLYICTVAFWIYRQGGVVRDVPELDLYKGSADPTVFERYTDRIYQYDREFSSESSRPKVLIIGNSFARDFANILLESPDSSKIQISYHYTFEDCPMSRIRECDRIYFFGWKHDVPSEVWQNLNMNADIWGIGTKNHGTSNGIFYKNRHRVDYFAQRTTILHDYYAVNQLLKEEWKEKYVDLQRLTLQPDSTVPVFTPDRHFITYDGRHLTPAGARYYALLSESLWQ